MINTEARPIIDSHNPTTESIPISPVIEGVEKLEVWIEHRETVVQELCPVGALETLYTERAALYLWRLNRVIGFDNAATIGDFKKDSIGGFDNSSNRPKHYVLPDQSTLQIVVKYEAHLNRCLASTMTELRRLQKERRQGLRVVDPGGGGAGRVGACRHQQIKDGSPGGSPSQFLLRPAEFGSTLQVMAPI
jgi:hypothetical protein